LRNKAFRIFLVEIVARGNNAPAREDGGRPCERPHPPRLDIAPVAAGTISRQLFYHQWSLKMSEIAKACADYRKKHGAEALRALIAEHGGSGSYSTVPEENLPAFAKAIGLDLAKEKPRREESLATPTQRTLPEIRAELNAMNQSAFQKFNSATVRHFNIPKIVG
jgi:hypothetical protein